MVERCSQVIGVLFSCWVSSEIEAGGMQIVHPGWLLRAYVTWQKPSEETFVGNSALLAILLRPIIPRRDLIWLDSVGACRVSFSSGQQSHHDWTWFAGKATRTAQHIYFKMRLVCNISCRNILVFRTQAAKIMITVTHCVVSWLQLQT